ncbi:TPA: polysaccharide biosynthesis protein, partial [Escherichia coli]|nr:polysaccharide biosynthesis protein [Escherichia coli]HDY1376255.1 polysaccharide biosynthesis protein [Escherichia coli]
GTKVIYIETWSRFTTYSLSGRIMYRLSNKFYIQNKSLLELYPKAIYSGRL